MPSEFKENAESLNTGDSVQVDVNGPMSAEEMEAYAALVEVQIPGTWSRSERNALIAANITAARRLLAEVKRIRHENEYHQRYRYTAEQNAQDTARENRKLREELAALAEFADSVRRAQPRSNHNELGQGWNACLESIQDGLTSAVLAALDVAPEMPRPPAEEARCTCSPTDPSTWETYGGLTEPTSSFEWDPDCPAHGTKALNEAAQERAGDAGTPGTGSGRGTGVTEASGTAQVGDDA